MGVEDTLRAQHLQRTLAEVAALDRQIAAHRNALINHSQASANPTSGAAAASASSAAALASASASVYPSFRSSDVAARSSLSSLLGTSGGGVGIGVGVGGIGGGGNGGLLNGIAREQLLIRERLQQQENLRLSSMPTALNGRLGAMGLGSPLDDPRSLLPSALRSQTQASALLSSYPFSHLPQHQLQAKTERLAALDRLSAANASTMALNASRASMTNSSQSASSHSSTLHPHSKSQKQKSPIATPTKKTGKIPTSLTNLHNVESLVEERPRQIPEPRKKASQRKAISLPTQSPSKKSKISHMKKSANLSEHHHGLDIAPRPNALSSVPASAASVGRAAENPATAIKAKAKKKIVRSSQPVIDLVTEADPPTIIRKNKRPSRLVARYAWDELELGTKMGTPAYNAYLKSEQQQKELDPYNSQSSFSASDVTALELSRRIDALRPQSIYLPADTPLQEFVERYNLDEDSESESLSNGGFENRKKDTSKKAPSKYAKGTHHRHGEASDRTSDAVPKRAGPAKKKDYSTHLHEAIGRVYNTICRQDADNHSKDRLSSNSWSVSDVKQKIKTYQQEIEALDEREKRLVKESKLLGKTDVAGVMDEAWVLNGLVPP